MGYSISARFATSKERDRMWDFLQTLDWKALEDADPVMVSNLVQGEDLSYPPKAPKCLLIGFNARVLPLSSWAVVSWMATQSHFRHKQERVFYYDRERHTLVPPGEWGKRPNTTEADARGIMVLPKPSSWLARIGEVLDFRCDKRAVLAWVEEMDRQWAAWQAAPAVKAPQRRPGASAVGTR